MSRKSTIDLAKDQIKSFFADRVNRVISTRELYSIILTHAEEWGIASTLYHKKIASQLVLKGIVRLIVLEHATRGKKNLYAPISWKEDPYEIGMQLAGKVYFSHYTAMVIHGLSDQIPKSYFVNYERPTPSTRVEINQDIIDKNYSKSLNRSGNVFSYRGLKFYLLQGTHTGYLGVQDLGDRYKMYCTNLERTMIDITVRPNYSGGVTEVLEAFRRAKGSLDIRQLVSYLKQIQHKYPYHQAIGFYMSLSGYPENDLRRFREMGTSYKFYLTHGMRKTKLSDEWNIHYPQGL